MGVRMGMGIVMAADGGSAQYADAVHVALHNIRTLHRSPLPVEVSHVVLNLPLTLILARA
jgi:hypothetical protein